MHGDEEMLRIEEVIARLIARYPSIPPEDIEQAVRDIHKRFVDGKVRDFVPLLVEKAARRHVGESLTPSAEPTVLPPAG
jgi:hypothetical protein